jgi:hypothetical protein
MTFGANYECAKCAAGTFRYDVEATGGGAVTRLVASSGTAATPTVAKLATGLCISHCMKNHHLAAGVCTACEAGKVREAGDAICTGTPCTTLTGVAHGTTAGSAGASPNTACRAVKCAADHFVNAAHKCVKCAAGKTRAAGDDASGTSTTCAQATCLKDQYVLATRPAGREVLTCTNCVAGYTMGTLQDLTTANSKDANGVSWTASVTPCHATVCKENYHVDTNKCVACAANKLNPAGDDARGGDTTCDGFLRCAVNEEVVKATFTCAACALGKNKALDANGLGLERSSAAGCDDITCAANEHVDNHKCVACDPTETNLAGDNAFTSQNTVCDQANHFTTNTDRCANNERVVNHACVACVAGTYSPAGADPNGQDTYCSATTPAAISHAASLCSTGEHVVDHVCVTCATTHGNAFYENAAGDDRNHQNTYCTKKLCAVDQKVVSNVCTNCGALLKAPAAWIGGADTACH